MRAFSLTAVATATILSMVGCGLSSSLVPDITDDTAIPVADAGAVDASADVPVLPIKDATADVLVPVKDAEVDAPVLVVIHDASDDAPVIRGRTLPDASPVEDGSVVVNEDASEDASEDTTTTVGDDASEDGGSVVDASPVIDAAPVADAAPACYTVCDNQCTSCKWVCVNTLGCSDTERETCSLKCTTVQSDCHTVCDTHGCGGY